MRVILCVPGEEASVIDIEGRKEIKELLGEYYKISYMPYGDDAVIVHSQDGYIGKGDICRIIETDKYAHEEVIRGAFIICDSKDHKSTLCGLSESQAEKYMEIFREAPSRSRKIQWVKEHGGYSWL